MGTELAETWDIALDQPELGYRRNSRGRLNRSARLNQIPIHAALSCWTGLLPVPMLP
jgi:hypothetical protein